MDLTGGAKAGSAAAGARNRAQRRIPFAPALMLALLVLAGAAVAAVLVHVAASGQNAVAVGKETHAARAGIHAALEDLGATTVDYAWWDEARLRLLDAPDPDWAAFNIGSYLHKTFGVGAALVFDPAGQVVFAVRDGVLLPTADALRPDGGLDRLLAGARASPFDPVRAATGILRLDGRPFLTAAAPLSPERPADPPPADGAARGVLVLLKPLDGPVLDRMAARLLLNDLRFDGAAAEGAPGRVALSDAGGTGIGALVWTPDRPGDALIGWLLPSLVVAGLMIGLLALQIARAWRGERRRADTAQGQLAAVLDGAADAFVTVAADGRIVASNRAAERLFGRTGGGLDGLSLGALLRAAETGAIDPATLAAAADGSDLVAVRPCGDTLPVEVRVSRLALPGEELYAAVIRDISARKRLEQSLREAKEVAELASQAKSRFVATMTHELRTPLNAVIGFSEIMKMQALGPLGNPMYATYAGDIHESGIHLLDLINDILDIARFEAGDMELLEKPVSLALVATACLRLFRDRAERAGVALADDVGHELPALLADERMVKQMLNNLLSNAVKFTPSGGQVRLHAEPMADGGLALSVSDTGAGIPAEALPRVFEPFFQADDGLARSHEGAGLGLPLTRALVERHGGRIVLDSHPGQGTTATLLFPAARVLR